MWFVVTLFFTIFTSLNAWGPIGHSTIASIGQGLLSESSQIQVNTLIPDGNMSAVANWADEVRSLPYWKWSEPLHFINTPAWNCSYIQSRDCYNDQGQFGYCVDGAISNYTNILKRERGDFKLQQDALKFIIHFVGDIHQPLHCGFDIDRGGNSINVKFFDHYTNLHAVWDSGIIEKRINDDFNGFNEAWLTFLLKTYVNDKNIREWSQDVFSFDWGNDSTHVACSSSYVQPQTGVPVRSGDNLGTDYYSANLPIIEERIAMAGVRLAVRLNSIFV